MVAFGCALEDLLAAKAKLDDDSSDNDDPGDYLCRTLIFCEPKIDASEDLSAFVELIVANLSKDANCAGRIVQYAKSFIVLLETPHARLDFALRYFDEQVDSAHICSTEEGVEQLFSGIALINESRNESHIEHVVLSDDSKSPNFADILSAVTCELLREEPKTHGIDVCLSKIAASGTLFSCREFLDVYDIETHICRAIAYETPQVEDLIIESDVLAL